MDKNVLVTLDQFEAAEQYWLGKLSGELIDLRLPPDNQGLCQYEPGSYKPVFDPGITEKLTRIGKGNDLSLYIILLAFYKVFLFKYTGQRDIVTASPVYSESNRKYNKFVVFRDTLDDAMNFKDVLMAVKQTVVEGYKNEHYPFANLIESLGLGPDQLPQLTRHIVSFENIHKTGSPGDTDAEPGNDITFTITKNSQTLEGEVLYNSKRFGLESIRRFFDAYLRIIEQMLTDTGTRIEDVRLVTEEEKEQLLIRFNETQRAFPGEKTIHQLFEEQAHRRAEETAVCSTMDIKNIYDQLKLETVDIQFSYEELNERANQLAAVLRERGVQPDTIVGLMVRHPLELAVGIFGILKAGGAYLPIDSQYPAKVITHMLEDSRAPVVVTEVELTDALPASTFPPTVVLIDESASGDIDTNPPPVNSSSDAAYVIYTSGTTGRSKGVVVEHKGVVNFILWRLEAYNYTETDVTLQPLSCSFDGFVTNFYSSLFSGGVLVIVPDSRRMDFEYMKNAVIENRVTAVSLVPGMYGMLLDGMEKEDLQSLRLVVLAGEDSGEALIQRSREKAPHILLVNEYGPTEITVTAAAHWPIDASNTAIIGRPTANKQIYILDPMGSEGSECTVKNTKRELQRFVRRLKKKAKGPIRMCY
ncbi:MAG: AMP-binding protein, partial [bacterium]|nr:AMP-binding protein [bacterium]